MSLAAKVKAHVARNERLVKVLRRLAEEGAA